jgi:hypothetical protein
MPEDVRNISHVLDWDRKCDGFVLSCLRRRELRLRPLFEVEGHRLENLRRDSGCEWGLCKLTWTCLRPVIGTQT